MCMLKIGNFQIMDHVGIVHNSYREGERGMVRCQPVWTCGVHVGMSSMDVDGCGWTVHTFSLRGIFWNVNG